MVMDKYGCFIQTCVYYYWNHAQQSMKTRHFSKVIYVFQRSCSCLLDTWNKKVPLRLFLCTEQFTYTNLFTFLQDRAAHFFWTCKMYIAYIVYYYICLPLCSHILYFDAAKFSIKFIDIFNFLKFLLSDNGMNMKKWLKRYPLRLHN